MATPGLYIYIFFLRLEDLFIKTLLTNLSTDCFILFVMIHVQGFDNLGSLTLASSQLYCGLFSLIVLQSPGSWHTTNIDKVSIMILDEGHILDV